MPLCNRWGWSTITSWRVSAGKKCKLLPGKRFPGKSVVQARHSSSLCVLQCHCAVLDQESEELQTAHDNSAIAPPVLIPLSQPHQGSDFLGGKTVPGEQHRFSQRSFYLCCRFARMLCVGIHGYILSMPPQSAGQACAPVPLPVCD